MTAVREESDERIIHRLEAFSDVVIGFSLAELGLNLVIPAHAIEVFTRPIQIFALVITFTIVSRVWWSHHKLFSHFFVPGRWTIFLNFATLGMVIFAVYSVQLVAHGFGGHAHQDPVALMIYVGSFGLLFALLGVQYLIGWRIRHDALPAEIADGGLRDGILLSSVGGAFIAGVGIIIAFGGRPMSMLVFGVVVIAIVRIARAVIGARQRRRRAAAGAGLD